jgi:sugar phosphate isomerase/epimerase
MKKSSTLLLLLGIVFFSACSSNKFGGMTLYTVRDDMKANPKEVLKKIADIGYKNIEEASGYAYATRKFYGLTPVEFKETLVSLGLKPLSTHQPSVTFDNADDIIADAKAAGFEYFVIPVPPMGRFKYDPATRSLSMSEDVEFIANFLNVIGKKCADAGIKLLYHNHNFEFKANSKGIVPIDYFLANTDPKYVNFQLDLYWITKAEANPITYFEKYPGRFKIWHVKDMDKEGRFAPVGNGTIDFAKILAKKGVSGMQYYIVEQDMTYDGMKPIEAITISHKALKKFGFR